MNHMSPEKIKKRIKAATLKLLGLENIENRINTFESRVEALMKSESRVVSEERNTIRQIIKKHFPEEVQEVKRKDGSIILEKYKDRFYSYEE